jgi:hypothetical protein
VKKILDAIFFSKSAPQSLPPQLLEASYAPEKYIILFENYLYFHDSTEYDKLSTHNNQASQERKMK